MHTGKLFHFKHFSLSDAACAMKIGTDGVLLGAFAASRVRGRVLDIGTGSGLIALMIAQKTAEEVHAIEIDADAYAQAKQNISNSPWNVKIKVFHTALQTFIPPGEKKYDHIVCNPPYFKNSLHSPLTARTTARHNFSLNLRELFLHASAVLRKEGSIILITPASEEKEINEAASAHKLICTEQLFIKANEGKLPKRIISVFAHKGESLREVIKSTLCIETGQRHQFTEEYKALTSDYHPFL